MFELRAAISLVRSRRLTTSVGVDERPVPTATVRSRFDAKELRC